MHVKIGRTFSLCTMKPWIKALEDELTFTKVNHQHGYVRSGQPRVTFETKRLYHVPSAKPTEGTFPAGLLPRALDFLSSRGHTYEFEDFRDITRLKPKPDFSRVSELRPGQGEALIQIAHADCGIIVAATAFGKSFIITQAAKMYPDLRFLVVSPRVAVVNSLYERLVEECGVDEVGRVGGGKRVLGRRVTVSTARSMHKVDPSEVDILFFDEVHGVGDNDVAKTIGYYDDCRRFGFTASPVRGDKSEMCMEALFGRFLVEVSYQEAVDLGNVVPIDVYMVRVGGFTIRTDNSSYKNKRLSYWTNEPRNKIIAKVARKVPEDQQCLIFVETLEHAVHLHKLLPEYTMVHFGAVKLDYLAYEWRRMSQAQASRSGGWARTGDGSTWRLSTVEDIHNGTPIYCWACSRKTDKKFKEAAAAAGREIRFLGRLQAFDEIADQGIADVKEGDYYLIKQEEYILDVPKSSLKLTAKQKEELRRKFESGELKKVIATTTWKEGVDFEQLETVIRADGSSSKVVNTQMPGRLSRLFEGKASGKLIDFRDEFNDWARNRTNVRLRVYREHQWSVHN